LEEDIPAWKANDASTTRETASHDGFSQDGCQAGMVLHRWSTMRRPGHAESAIVHANLKHPDIVITECDTH